jgi:general secretion pathway protein C
MQNIKYHSLNIISMMIFSFMLATTINQVIKYKISPGYSQTTTTSRKTNNTAVRKNFDDYKVLTESGFFKVASASDIAGDTQGSTSGSISELTLLGTITGPTSIARAMILKTGETSPKIFATYKVNNETSNDVWGNKLVWIADSKVFLEVGGQKMTLELYAKKTVDPNSQQGAAVTPAEGGGQQFNQTLSRAEIRQKVFNNMDNALQGLQAGPYRINGQIVGYRLINVRPNNIMFKLGARSGDIVRRVNGQILDSTQKLMGMWETIKNDPKITVDLEREGKNIRYDFNITD